MRLIILICLCYLLGACASSSTEAPSKRETTLIAPVYVSEPVPHDSDDPAIWVNPTDPAQSLIVGTDKSETEGGLYVFDLQGKLVRAVPGLARPNNVDIAYGIVAGGDTFDIAVCSERMAQRLRVFRLPEMTPVDGGGLPVFENESQRDVMGIALYTRPADRAIFACVSRKEFDPAGPAIWQYQLQGQPDGTVQATEVRRFGQFSGQKEVEAIAADDALGYLYYSDEGVGVRKYHADPAKQNDEELAFFATEGFREDHEGISIYPTGDSTGYILVSDQAANQFHVFTRQLPHELVTMLPLSTTESDGSEVTAISLNEDFPQGLFVAMSDDRTFHLYDWRDLDPAKQAKP
jgi:3-phytase